MEPDSEIITSAEAAKILGLSSSTFHRWVNAGRLTEVAKVPGIRGARMFRRSDVEALLDETEAVAG